MIDPFEAPGDDQLREMSGARPSASDSLLVRGKRGGIGGAARKVLEDRKEAEAKPEPLDMQAAEPVEEKPLDVEALLSFGTWSKPDTCFHEEAEVSVRLALPKGKEHLTRVEAELHAEMESGLKLISKGESHAQADGTAVFILPVYKPDDYQSGIVKYALRFRHKLAKVLSPDDLFRMVSETALKSADHVLIPGIAFSKDTSFIGPKAAEGLKLLETRFGEWEKKFPKKTKIVVYGHANPDEKEPKALSERRAQSAFAFITNDADTWEKLYNQEKWGLVVFQVLLQELGHYDGKPNGKENPQTLAAFKAFQKSVRLPETGKEDVATRKALFAAYMKGKHDIKIEASRFRKVAGNPWMGCGSNNQVKDGKASAPENRRVAFILVNESKYFPPNFPCQDGNESSCQRQCKREGKRSAPAIHCLYYDELVREEKQSLGEEDIPEGTIKLAKAQEIAFEVSSDFEGEGYTALAGDGDDQGISFGCMQWNIGQNTLQPLWKKFWDRDKKAFRECFDTHDDAFAQVEKILKGTTNAKALKWARSTHSVVKKKPVWKDPWKKILLSLASVPAFQEIQRSEAGALNHPPTLRIIAWLRKQQPNLFKLFELRSYVALFDLCNQQGSVKQDDYKVVEGLYKTKAPASQKEAMEILCANRALSAKRVWRADSGSRRLGILAADATAFPNGSHPSPGLDPVTRPNKKYSLLKSNPLIEDL